MYQPYPTSAQLPDSARPPAPPSVQNAVKVMYVGAVASIIGIAIDLATIGSLKSNLAKKHPSWTATQLTHTEHVLTFGFVIGGVLGAALWLFIAQNCKAGRNWARITGTVLFCIATIDTLTSLALPVAAAVRPYGILVWLIGLAAIVLLWRGSSSEYFNAGAAYRG
jgi:hypothetical protein